MLTTLEATRIERLCAVGPTSPRRVPAVLPQSSPSHGLPALSGQRLADRFRPGGERLQDGGRQSPQRQRHALGRRRLRRRLPPPRPVPQPARPVGILLEKLPKLTTNVTLGITLVLADELF